MTCEILTEIAWMKSRQGSGWVGINMVHQRALPKRLRFKQSTLRILWWFTQPFGWNVESTSWTCGTESRNEHFWVRAVAKTSRATTWNINSGRWDDDKEKKGSQANKMGADAWIHDVNGKVCGYKRPALHRVVLWHESQPKPKFSHVKYSARLLMAFQRGAA